MALLLLVFWASVPSLLTPVALSRAAPEEPAPLDSDDGTMQKISFNLTEALRDPKDANHTGNQSSTPSPWTASSSTPSPWTASSSTPSPWTASGTSEEPFARASIHAPNSTTSPGNSTQDISNSTSHLVPIAENSPEPSNVTGVIMPSHFLATSNGTSEPSITTATNFLESSNKTSGFPVTEATKSLEPSNGKDGPPVTMTTQSLESSGEPSVTMVTASLEPSSGPPVTMTNRSLEPSHRPPVTMVTSSLEPSRETSGLSITIATSSPAVSSVASGSTVSNTELPVVTTSKSWTGTSLSPSQTADQGSSGMLLVPMLVALLVVIVLLALLLLWRQRQKQRTGVLKLTRGGKHNGVVDAWAGPAQVPDEEAMTAIVGESGGNKGSGIPETDGSSQKPSLTTFFGKRKSHCSLALEELKPGPGPSLKGEEEPLVGSEDELGEAPSPNGPQAGDGAACE